MKYPLILTLLMLTMPAWLSDLGKDRLRVFASLSYYKCDFDGDKKEDFSIWDAKSGTLYFQLSSDGKSYQKKFFEHDIEYEPVFADYDGDGKTDFVFYQPETGQWVFHLTSAGRVPEKVFFGNSADLPIPVKIEGGKKYGPAIWRPNAGVWLVLNEDEKGNKNALKFIEGSYQDSVFAGDCDGDGKSDLVVWRPDDGYWHVLKSSTNFDHGTSEHIQHGQEWDVIVPNDYDGDGKCDLVVWRPEEQNWYFRYANGKTGSTIKFGEKGDIPLSGDMNGDGIPELITWNRTKKSWNVFNLKTQESLSYKWEVPNGSLPAVSVLQKFE